MFPAGWQTRFWLLSFAVLVAAMWLLKPVLLPFLAGARLAVAYDREEDVHVDDLDISPSKIGETAQRIVDRALEEARRREHALLTNEHIFLAFARNCKASFSPAAPVPGIHAVSSQSHQPRVA